ncbi:hypothetical protein GLW08_09655 [Pontibacillus yanchengensis]|uniref:Uncharacterized protein n=2 Tax=Pontibacillus yanchengensis TaxID=462910 RepID=A0ACC7VFZ5_9BACI|nr:hypothetical protein [Pontibacillus yanchengensis]MYL33550.1 hypothetical protein [Pontibacillus yanchengensis]MYL53600.1 hypothetical protein [Pontibacillus yanchengensis]
MQKSFTKLLFLLCAFLLFSGLSTFDHERAVAESDVKETSQQENLHKRYPLEIMEPVRKSMRINKHSTEKDEVIMSRPKVEILERYYFGINKPKIGYDVKRAVEAIFGYDLDEISSYLYHADDKSFSRVSTHASKQEAYSEEIMKGVRKSLGIKKDSDSMDEQIMAMPKAKVFEHYFNGTANEKYAQEAKEVILNIYGINLQQISGLKNMGISIASKGIWITHSETDLFVIHSTTDDVGVKIYPTEYFKSSTGTSNLPNDVKNQIKELGFSYDNQIGAYYYENPKGVSVPDQFKGKVVQSLITEIKSEYAYLVE